VKRDRLLILAADRRSVACPRSAGVALDRAAAAENENVVSLMHSIAFFGAAAQPIVGKPDSYALRAEAD
jgi:hypothetical protein